MGTEAVSMIHGQTPESEATPAPGRDQRLIAS